MKLFLKSRGLLLCLIAAVVSTSCQSNKHNAYKSLKDPLDIGSSQIGEGAVPSQVDMEPWHPKDVSSCAASIQMPSEEYQLADKSNYGSRDKFDYMGQRIASSPRFVVIHETVMGERDTISLFKKYHANDNDQVSYHVLVARDGRLIRIVPDQKRAYGAGMSHFIGSTLRAKKGGAGSVNNVSLHISLVSPAGYEHSDSHSGYTDAQYSSLAKQILNWQMKYGIPMSRVTTHYAVDRSHTRYDPRSFYWDKFDQKHQLLTEICAVPRLAQPVS
jgi:N-acetyl-anhydromuramyl-L-alanine amidase AmpD